MKEGVQLFTAEESIKLEILETLLADLKEGLNQEDAKHFTEIDTLLNKLKILEAYNYTIENGWLCQDLVNEFRQSGISTNLPSEYSRHYESDFVARRLSGGTWIGWIYWHGGGKFGEPESIDWMSDAKFLDVEEHQEMVTIRKFSIKNE